MGITIVDKTTPSQGAAVDSHGSQQFLLYDANGNGIAAADKATVLANQNFLPIQGLDAQ